MTDPESDPQHHRRRANGAARAVFDEARRAGLVQRHLRKLHHLAVRRPPDHPDPAHAGIPPSTTSTNTTIPSTSEMATAQQVPRIPPSTGPATPPSTSEAA
ncbi:hypothetical protein OHS18_18930 [Amycolatopsis sp. NBC_00355]|uniref:hypothetical protein n=1 Tax=Amycolatopsis sp. NBC_00355 TaxID=2975957 RepID=UPI002E2595A2